MKEINLLKITHHTSWGKTTFFKIWISASIIEMLHYYRSINKCSSSRCIKGVCEDRMWALYVIIFKCRYLFTFLKHTFLHKKFHGWIIFSAVANSDETCSRISLSLSQWQAIAHSPQTINTYFLIILVPEPPMKLSAFRPPIMLSNETEEVCVPETHSWAKAGVKAWKGRNPSRRHCRTRSGLPLPRVLSAFYWPYRSSSSGAWFNSFHDREKQTWMLNLTNHDAGKRSELHPSSLPPFLLLFPSFSIKWQLFFLKNGLWRWERGVG